MALLHASELWLQAYIPFWTNCSIFLQAPFTSVILSFFNNGSLASVRELPTKLSPYPPYRPYHQSISQGMFYILRNVILQLTAQQ